MSLDDQLLELEQRFLDPEHRRHAGRLADLLDDDFTEYGSSGRVFTKAEVLALIGATPERTFVVEDFHVRVLAPGCVLATFRVLGGGARSLRSSIWQRRGGEWKMIFHQGTPSP